MQSQDVKPQVKAVYGKAVLQAAQGERACCGAAPARAEEPITSHLYAEEQIAV